MPKYKILFLDDDEMVLKVAQLYLKSDQIELILARTGKECLEILHSIQAKELKLILLDSMLPDTNGISILKIIKQHKELSKIPVIIQTGIMSIDTNLITRLGGKVIYKPYSKTDLLEEFTKLGFDLESLS
ncbi:MAG UNVERIFIED_CONTAM: response regulator [Rickettsiaceae bacterium]|jgi:DNA-binding response OmpR family regulator